MASLDSLVDEGSAADEREVIAVLEPDIEVRHLRPAVGTDEGNHDAVGEHPVRVADRLPDEFLRGDLDLLDIAGATESVSHSESAGRSRA